MPSRKGNKGNMARVVNRGNIPRKALYEDTALPSEKTWETVAAGTVAVVALSSRARTWPPRRTATMANGCRLLRNAQVNGQSVPGSPFGVTVMPGPMRQCFAIGDGISQATVGEEGSFVLYGIDKFQNATSIINEPCTVMYKGPDECRKAKVLDCSIGTFYRMFVRMLSRTC